MSHNTKIGIVTAAGYIEAGRYYERLHGLLEAVRTSTMLTMEQKQNIIVMGESQLGNRSADANFKRWRVQLSLQIFSQLSSPPRMGPAPVMDSGRDADMDRTSDSSPTR